MGMKEVSIGDGGTAVYDPGYNEVMYTNAAGNRSWLSMGALEEMLALFPWKPNSKEA